jgi:chemotaxis protein methyltransferase CheR
MKDRAAVRAAIPAVSGEFGFRGEDFEFIASTLYNEAGIHLAPSKANLVYSRLTKRLRSLGLESFAAYCDLIGSADGTEERAQMIAALTTNVTRFFREPHHFDHLKTRLLPPLVDAVKKKSGRIRIWSAGCSSGQEPFSIALTVLSLLPDARSYDVRILATDINPYVLETARKGLYPEEDVDSVPADLRRAWTEPVGGGVVQMDDGPRSLITFRPLNLMGQWPMQGPFDAIFCRNVVIYFDEKTQIRMWNRMSALLKGNGCLYLGHSERLTGPAEALYKPDGTTTYRKIVGGAA